VSEIDPMHRVSPLAVVLLEARDDAADRVLAALSEGGAGARVRRVTTREALRDALAAGPVDAVVAGVAAEGAAAILEDARAFAPSTPVVLVGEGALEDACDWLAAGAAAVVSTRRLDRLADALSRATREVASRRARDDFLARVAHQLRTPQGALLGWTSLLARKKLDEGATARALDTIARNARLQSRMLDDLLDVSRLISGSLTLDRAPTDLCALVAAAVDARRPTADKEGVALHAELDPHAGSALVDGPRLEQVVRELVKNAIRATPRGGRVNVRLTRDGSAAAVSVDDTGCGIGADVLPRLFEDLTPVARPARHGLGVGLWVARRLVELHGGTVTAESPGEGLGATFTVRIPALH
jgi:signal transduction histidine kinase